MEHPLFLSEMTVFEKAFRKIFCIAVCYATVYFFKGLKTYTPHFKNAWQYNRPLLIIVCCKKLF